MKKLLILLFLTPTLLFAQLRSDGLRKKTNTTSHISIADTLEATKAKIDTLEGLSTDSVFTKADMVFLQDILFKASSSNVSHWVDSGGDTVLTFDPNGASGPVLIFADGTAADTVQLYHDGTNFNIVPDAGTGKIDIDGKLETNLSVTIDSSRNEGTFRQKDDATFGATATDVVISSAGNVTLNSTVADQEHPTFVMKSDFDTDASATTGYTLTWDRTGNATPTSGYWTCTSSGGLGVQMPNMSIGSAPISGVSLNINGAHIRVDQATNYTLAFGNSSQQNNSGLYSNAFGYFSQYINSGSKSNAFGNYSQQNNSGAKSNAFGYFSQQNNNEAECSAFGNYSQQNNDGAKSNAFGCYSQYINSGSNSNAFGYFSQYINSGANSNAFGSYSQKYNNGASSNAFGNYSQQYNDGDNNSSFGNKSFNTFTEDGGNAKTFASTDVIVDGDSIVISSHGFGSADTYVNLKWTATTGVLPTGISLDQIDQFYIAHADTIVLQTDDMTTQGSGNHTLTPQTVYTNSTALGYDAEPDASNQVMLGDGNVTQVKSTGSLYISGSNDNYINGTMSIGSWGYTGEHIVIPEASSNTNAGLGLYGMVNYAASAGKTIAGTYSRALCMTENQTNQATIVGTESQFRLRDVNIADGVHAGLWAYAEQSGTSVLSGNGTFDAINATVESESGFSVGATEQVTGLTLDSSINGSATINASANFTGLYIKSNGKDWFNGIWTTGCANDWKLRNGATIDNTDANTLTITEQDIDFVGNLSATTYSIDANEAVILPAPGTLTDGQYAGARIITLTAGYGTTAIGDLVYLNNDDSKFEKTDGNAAATAADVLVGVVLEAVAENASCKIMLEGTITVDAWDWATVGASLFISGTAGGFTQTRLAVTNDIVRIVGYALDDDTIYFCPDNAYATVE